MSKNSPEFEAALKRADKALEALGLASLSTERLDIQEQPLYEKSLLTHNTPCWIGVNSSQLGDNLEEYLELDPDLNDQDG